MADIAPTQDPAGGRSFVSPAKCRILLTPAHPSVTPAEFEEWSSYVRSFESIRIKDLPPSTSGRSGPAPGSSLHTYGEVHLSFITSYDPQHAFLAPFAMHRQVLGVLGLGSYSAAVDKMELERAPSALRELHPNAIVHRAYMFDTEANKPSAAKAKGPEEEEHDATEVNGETLADASVSSEDMAAQMEQLEEAATAAGFAGRGNSGLVIFPAVRRDGKDVRFYLRTLLRDFLGSILDGLDCIVKGLEGKPLETPRETLDGLSPTSSTSPSSSLTSSASSTAALAASRASSFFSSFGSAAASAAASASPPMGGGSLPAVLSPGASSDSKTAASRSSASKSTAGKRSASLVGAGPSGAGRYCKIKADYALLSGDLWGAIINYDACMTWLGKERALAGGQDAVWYASALEGWAVTRCLIFRMSGLEEKGPSLSLPPGGVKEKGKDKELYEPPFARFEWGEVAEAYSLAIQIYSKTLAPPRYLLESVRSVNPDTPRDYTHPLIHASACIAYARFLLAVWASSGWNGECFDQLIYGGVPPALVEDARPGPAMYAALSKSSGVQRHEIAIPTSLALSHSVAALKPPDQISVLCSLASIYGCIGFPRREAYLLRQLQATVVSLLARTLMLNPREPVTIMSALKQIAGSDHTVLGTMVTQSLTSGLGEGADAVLILALQICETYGINVDIDPLKNIPPHHILSRAALSGKTTTTQQPLLKKAGVQAPGKGESDRPTLHDEAAFGWADLQIALLKDTICVAEMLQDHVGMAFFATVLLRDFHELLSGDEQRNLIRGIANCVRTARWQDAQDLEVHYWGPPDPLCSIEPVPMPTLRLPTEHPAKDLVEADKEADTAAQGSAQVAGLNNPFFWNPLRATGAAKQQMPLVQDEQAEFLLTLQNPLKAPLELTNVRLSTSGGAFDADSIDVVLPPLAYYTVRLTGIPRAGTGTLSIRGCFATLAGCLEREFKVSLNDETSEKLRLSREAELDDRRTRLKTQGLDARPAISTQKRALAMAKASDDKVSQAVKRLQQSSASAQEQFLQCRLVPSQPLLAIDSPSLTHGQMILFDGEQTTLKLRLTNISSLPVDFARLSFSDDLSEDIRASLSEGDLLPADAHQLEWQLLHQPVFTCTRRPRAIKVMPGRSILVPISVRGKLDCTRGTVHVDFAHVDAPGRGGLVTEETKNFHTRRTSMAFGMTVYPVVECGALDVRVIGGGEAERIVRGASKSAKRITINGAGHKHDETAAAPHADMACLLSLDVRNVHQHAVDVELTLARDDGPPLHFQRSLPIGLTAHLVMALPRLSLPDSKALAPIPSLSSRQFILSRVKLSPSEEQKERRRFWYRQELLGRLTATWTEARTGRRGVIGLEEQVLSDEHVDVLRREDVEVGLELLDEQGQALSRDYGGEKVSSASAESFLTVRAAIVNRSSRPLKLLYRLVPLPSTALDTSTDLSSASLNQQRIAQASSAPGANPAGGQALAAAGTHSTDATLSQVLITDGSLSAPVRPWPLLPGEEATITTGVCFLAQGKYAFVGAVEEELHLDAGLGGEELNERISEVGRSRLVVDVKEPEE